MRDRSRTLLILPFVTAWLVLGAVEKPTVLLTLVVLSLGALVVGSGLAIRAARPEPTTAPVRLPTGQRWIAVSWFLMFAVSEQRFTAGRSPLDATSGSVSAEIVVELFVYGMTVLMIMWRWQQARGTASTPEHVRPLFAWPLFAILSTTWSVVPLFSFVRGMEMLVPPLLAVHSARVIRQCDDGGKALVHDTMRLFIFGLTGAVTIGWFVPWPYLGDRFAWTGTHPLVVANLLGVALLTLVIAGKSVLGFKPWTRAALILYFLITLIYCQPRTDYAALGIASLIGLWWAGRHRVGFRTFGLAVYVAGFATFVVVLKGQIFDIASHGGGYQGAATFNGRTTLWQLSLSELHSVKDWLVGFGYGSPRVKIYSEVSWSGSAHSSPIELMLGIGVIGLVLFLIELGFVGWGLGSPSRTHHLDRSLQILGITLFAFIFVHGVVSSELVVPSSSCTMLAFLASWVLARPAHDTSVLPDFMHPHQIGLLRS